ncbi:MAG: hypothetical protein ACP5O0_05585 [Acidimicrobiales bacterium]
MSAISKEAVASADPFVVRQDVRDVAQRQLQAIEPRYSVVREVAGTGYAHGNLFPEGYERTLAIRTLHRCVSHRL